MYLIVGAVIVYDITDVDSFQRMKEWVRELRSQLDRESTGFDVPIIVVGNKCDLEMNRQVPLKDAEAQASKFGCQHFSASARSG